MCSFYISIVELIPNFENYLTIVNFNDPYEGNQVFNSYYKKQLILLNEKY